MKQLFGLLVGGAALAVAVQSCSTDPALYLGGPAGPIASLAVSSSRADLRVGSAVTIGARGVDAVGNTTADAPTFASCDGSVVSVGTASPFGDFPTAAQVSAVGLGVSCVTVTAGEFTENIVVATGPAGFRVVGPDTVGSGNEATFTIEPFDANGAALSGSTDYAFTSSNTARLSVDLPTGVAAGKSTGSVSVRAVAPGGANATKSVVVVPGVFGGALSAASGAPGALITATRAASGPLFDDDVIVRLGSVNAWVDQITSETVLFAVPATGSTAAGVLSLLNMGPNQIAQTTAFTATKAAEDVYSPANLDATCAGVPTAPTFAAVGSPGSAIYFTHNGTNQGTRGCQNGGAGPDHYFRYTTGASAEVVDFEARWTLSGDNDLLICTTDFASCPGQGFSGSSSQEIVSDAALAANTTYYVIYSPWTANAGTNNIQLKILKN